MLLYTDTGHRRNWCEILLNWCMQIPKSLQIICALDFFETVSQIKTLFVERTRKQKVSINCDVKTNLSSFVVCLIHIYRGMTVLFFGIQFLLVLFFFFGRSFVRLFVRLLFAKFYSNFEWSFAVFMDCLRWIYKMLVLMCCCFLFYIVSYQLVPDEMRRHWRWLIHHRLTLFLIMQTI